jgi:two-component system response regulator (stage 0 sporulation protein A)
MPMAYRIVVADDNPDLCQMLTESSAAVPDLELVCTVPDGRAALEAVNSCAPDLLLLDIVMPHLDGLGVLEALHGRKERPRVIILSAFAQEELITRAMALGADYYIMKPFDLPTLLQRLRQVAAQQPASQFKSEQRRLHIEQEVARQITDLGVPPHYKGYGYLLEAITLVVENRELLSGDRGHLDQGEPQRHSSAFRLYGRRRQGKAHQRFLHRSARRSHPPAAAYRRLSRLVYRA